MKGWKFFITILITLLLPASLLSAKTLKEVRYVGKADGVEVTHFSRNTKISFWERGKGFTSLSFLTRRHKGAKKINNINCFVIGFSTGALPAP